MILGLFLLACGLEVGELPENDLPVPGEIVLSSLSPEPLDTLRLSVEAEDPDGDPIFFRWYEDAGLGSWMDGEYADSVVYWIAPSSFDGIDSLQFTVKVYDFDLQNSSIATASIPLGTRYGSLRVLLRDLQGLPAEVDSLAITGGDTLQGPGSEFFIDSLPWGQQSAFSFQTDAYYGCTDLYPGYPDTVFIVADTENELVLTLAPRSLILIPGVLSAGESDTLLTTPQQGIDWAEAQGIDTLMLRVQDYYLEAQSPENAALVLDERDLLIRPFPGQGPLLLDAGEAGCLYGFYLKGRSVDCRIENIVMQNAIDAAVYLQESSASLDSLLLTGSSKGITFHGSGEDRLVLRGVSIRNNDYGIYQDGGTLDAEGLLIAEHRWYGLWSENAALTLDHLSVLESEVAGLILENSSNCVLSSSILAGNLTGIFLPPEDPGASPLLDCCLFFDNESDLEGAVSEGSDPVYEDPLFCDPESGDWRVDPEGPAQAGSCGSIGALGTCESRGGGF
ncbi:MAG: hypothetical protein QF492_01075 [Candidatus Krumholzibacteria bacterium]|nr:hypothetical protein [Candidatus Krumholzibacteria bacterium]MDP6668485.1 hypothetical protein [Candidatus Krumholzibacteria bacterium]MDP6797762.1 hypothetical protein [Candidatus Krumholzibacteria bacterium]